MMKIVLVGALFCAPTFMAHGQSGGEREMTRGGRMIVVEVSGAVPFPGLVQVRAGTEAYDALAAAGVSDYTKAKAVVVNRVSGESIILDLSMPPAYGTKFPLLAGDVLKVSGPSSPPKDVIGARMRVLTETLFVADATTDGWRFSFEPSLALEALGEGFFVPGEDGIVDKALLARVSVRSGAGVSAKVEVGSLGLPVIRTGRLVPAGESVAMRLRSPVVVTVPAPGDYTVEVSVGYADQCPSRSYRWLCSQPVQITVQSRN